MPPRKKKPATVAALARAMRASDPTIKVMDLTRKVSAKLGRPVAHQLVHGALGRDGSKPGPKGRGVETEPISMRMDVTVIASARAAAAKAKVSLAEWFEECHRARVR